MFKQGLYENLAPFCRLRHFRAIVDYVDFVLKIRTKLELLYRISPAEYNEKKPCTPSPPKNLLIAKKALSFFVSRLRRSTYGSSVLSSATRKPDDLPSASQRKSTGQFWWLFRGLVGTVLHYPKTGNKIAVKNMRINFFASQDICFKNAAHI